MGASRRISFERALPPTDGPPGMHGEIDWDQLAMYVFGEGTVDQRRRVEAWARSDPGHRSILKDLRTIYEETGRTPDERTREELRRDRTWEGVSAHLSREAGR